jgi:hypothetical protein
LHYQEKFSIPLKHIEGLVVPCTGVTDISGKYASRREITSTRYIWSKDRSAYSSTQCHWYVIQRRAKPPPELAMCAPCIRVRNFLDAQIESDMCLTPTKTRTVQMARSSPSSKTPISLLSRKGLITRYQSLASRYKNSKKAMDRIVRRLNAYREIAQVRQASSLTRVVANS